MDEHSTNARVLITGGAGGIGAATVSLFRARGWTVTVADIESEALQKLRDDGVSCHAYNAKDPGTIDALFARVGDELGHLDALINGAGLLVTENLDEATPEGWDDTFSVNARGVLFSTQRAVALLEPSAHPAVVNIASIAGRGVASRFPVYAASKAAVISLTQQCALTLAPRGIRVNAVCPGVVDTNFNAPIDAKFGVEGQGLKPGQLLDSIGKSVPLGRIGQPAEVAELIYFLASPASSFITGQAVNIDGGVHLA